MVSCALRGYTFLPDQIAAEVVKARLEAKTELAEESERLRVQEAKLRDEMALVRQQQQIHDRLVEDVATARSTLDACQAELRSKHEVRPLILFLYSHSHCDCPSFRCPLMQFVQPSRICQSLICLCFL